MSEPSRKEEKAGAAALWEERGILITLFFQFFFILHLTRWCEWAAAIYFV